ncbi:Ca-activated chloride channel family protein [Elusimicrobium posterum]|uniref:VWA domain-containing protein n=1 Tax=Elusimicrobium posterum TaxID=3116653 RepID=UPI003C7328C0
MSIALKILYIWILFFIILLVSGFAAPKGKLKTYLKRAAKASFAVCLILVFFNIYVFLFFKDTVFANPGWLFFVVPLILFAVSYPFIERFFTPSINYNLSSTPKLSYGAKTAKYFCFVLNIVAVVLILLALARPRDVDMTILPPTEGVDIILTLDTSVSMGAKDFFPDRLTAAKTAAQQFIAKRHTDRIGIVVFASEAMLQCPPTLDYDALTGFLNDTYIGIVRAQSTAIGDAIAVSAVHLESSQSKSKVIILITDGESNEGSVPPVTAAKAAAAMGIKIYTIALVGAGESGQFAEGQLREIAAVTGGRFFSTSDLDGLTRIYNEIDKLEKTQYDDLTVFSYDDRYHMFLALAAGLLLLSFILSKAVFVRIP